MCACVCTSKSTVPYCVMAVIIREYREGDFGDVVEIVCDFPFFFFSFSLFLSLPFFFITIILL